MDPFIEILLAAFFGLSAIALSMVTLMFWRMGLGYANRREWSPMGIYLFGGIVIGAATVSAIMGGVRHLG